MKKQLVLIALLLVVALSFTSCDLFMDIFGDVKVISKVNLRGSKSLFLNANSRDLSRGIDSSDTEILKISDNDTVGTISYESNRGKDLEQNKVGLYPIKVSDLNNGYMTIRFNPYPAIYLVRKSDGAAVCLNMVGNNRNNYSMGVRNYRYKSASEVYFITPHLASDNSWAWEEIRCANPSNGNVSVISPANTWIENFGVDSNGNVFAYLRDPYSEAFMMISASGSVERLNSSAFCSAVLFADRKDVFWGSSMNYGGSDSLYKYTIEDGTVSSTQYYCSGFCFSPEFFGSANKGYYLNNNVIKGNTDLGEPDYYNSKDPGTVECFDFDLGVGHTVDLGGFAVNQLVREGDYLYALGYYETSKSRILRIDPLNGETYTTVLDTCDYTINDFTYSEGNGLTFEATRLSDGKSVAGVGGFNDGGWLSVLFVSQGSVDDLTKVK